VDPGKIIDDAVERIRQQVGDDKVILGLSGGVDSSVTAMLLHRAIGKNLTCVFVDNGLLRLNEAQQVMDMFGDHFGLNIVHVEGERVSWTRWRAKTIRKRNVKSSAACSWKCSTKKR
jgi:GMP synthase (glutamine-hydrolysing)